MSTLHDLRRKKKEKKKKKPLHRRWPTENGENLSGDSVCPLHPPPSKEIPNDLSFVESQRETRKFPSSPPAAAEKKKLFDWSTG